MPAGDKAATPPATGSTSKTMEQRDATKPMGKAGMAPAAGGDAATTPTASGGMMKSADERTAAKANKKSNRMAKKTSPKPPADQTANPGSK